MFFTGITLKFLCFSGTLQRNATHFLISTDNREQTFKHSISRNLPIMWESRRMEEKPAFWKPIAAGGMEIESHKWHQIKCLRYSTGRKKRESGIWKWDITAVLVEWHQDLGSSWVIELELCAGKSTILPAVFLQVGKKNYQWIQMVSKLCQEHVADSYLDE